MLRFVILIFCRLNIKGNLLRYFLFSVRKDSLSLDLSFGFLYTNFWWRTGLDAVVSGLAGVDAGETFSRLQFVGKAWLHLFVAGP